MNRKIYLLVICLLFLILIPQYGFAEAGVESSVKKNAFSMKVMTFNIHSGINWFGRFDLDGLVTFLKEENPDIIGLQEVDRGWSSMSGFHDIPSELATRLNMFYAFTASMERNNGSFGNLILSKYPIIQIWTLPMPGSLEPRSFVFVQLLIHGIRVNFLTTHLGLSVSDRMQQTASILNYTSQIGGPIIITGDFNGNENDPAVANLKLGFIDLQDQSELKDQGTFRGKNGLISSKMDYIITTPEFSFSNFRIIDNYVSDHVPVVAELSLQVSPVEVIGQPVTVQP